MAAMVATLVLSSACGKSKDKDKELRRNRDQAAVVVVGGDEELGNLLAEAEPNNELAEAQAVSLGSGATGSLEGSLDIDRYLVETEEAGMLFVRLSGAADADLKLDMQDLEGKSLARSDRGPAGIEEGISGFWLEPGKTQLVVSEFTKKKLRKKGGRQGPSAAYRLEVYQRTTPEAGFELEANEDVEGAMEAPAGEERFGYLGWAGDSDVWRIPVTGFADVTAAPEEGVAPPKPALDIAVSSLPKLAITLELMDASGSLIASRRSAPGQEVAIRSFVPEVSSEFYLVKVGAKRSYPEEHYVLRVEGTELQSGQEEEPNDAMDVATPLPSETNGELLIAKGEVCIDDIDMFSISPAEMNRAMDLRLDMPGDADLSVSVVAESGAILAQSESEGVGVSETLQAVNVAPNSSPVIIVRVKKVSVPAAYKLSLSIAEGQGVPQAPVLPPPENPDLEE
jgi:hypothetical protein